MGRRKIEMKRIEDKSSRQVTFSKRRSGLIKKARELSVLCDVDVALIVFSSRGRLYEFFNGCSPSSSLSQVLERYEASTSSDGMIPADTEDMESSRSRFSDIKTCAELVEIAQRQMESPELEHLTVDDFVELEEQLAAALIETRARKTQLMLEKMMRLREQERMLQVENVQLNDEVAKLKDDSNNGFLEGGNDGHGDQAGGNHLMDIDNRIGDGRRMGLEFGLVGGNHNNSNQMGLEFSLVGDNHDFYNQMGLEFRLVGNNHNNANQMGLEFISLVDTHAEPGQQRGTRTEHTTLTLLL